MQYYSRSGANVQQIASRGENIGRQAIRQIVGASVGVFVFGVVLATQAIGQALPPPGSPIQRIAPPTGPKVAPGLVRPQAEQLQNLAPGTPRKVTAVAVEGSTILTADETATIAAGLVGPSVPTSAIEEARLTLLRRYRDASYPLVTVSATLTAAGRLRYAVTEGRIAEVQLDGDIGPAGTTVLSFLQNLVQPGPVNTSALERWLLLAQDVPGVSVQTILRPSETEPGALTMVAKVSRNPISGMLAVDNRAYRFTGPVEMLAVASFNSFTSLGERTDLSIFKSPLNPTQIFGQAAYETFIGTSGLKVRIYGGMGNSRPSGTLGTVGFNGQTQIAGTQVSYPVLYSRQQKLNILGMFDLINSSTYLSASGSAPNSKDFLRVFRVGGDYALLDNYLGETRSAVNQANIRVSHGIQGLGSSHTGSTSLGRQGSALDFTKINVELSRTQTLFSPWADASVSLLTLVTGQGSRNVLPSAEAFYLGGMRFTRGFYSGEVTGDNALAASAELQLNTTVQTSITGSPREIGVQYYGFYDWGQTWQNRALDTNQRLRSFGLGIRAALSPSLQLDVEGVYRLTRQPTGSASTVRPLGGQAVYWRLVARY